MDSLGLSFGPFKQTVELVGVFHPLVVYGPIGGDLVVRVNLIHVGYV